MTEPKNPKDMTQAERDALPGWTEYEAATAERKRTISRGIEPDDLAMFTGSDGVQYWPRFYDGVWYKL